MGWGGGADGMYLRMDGWGGGADGMGRSIPNVLGWMDWGGEMKTTKCDVKEQRELGMDGLGRRGRWDVLRDGSRAEEEDQMGWGGAYHCTFSGLMIRGR